jgi:LPXTG-motif cell wall-anchored protein
MRWLAWLFTGTTCLAGYGGPLPEIAVGTSGRELVIQSAPRLPEKGASQTFLVGTVTEVAAEEDRQPQQTRLSESCTLRVDSAYGNLEQVVGIQTVVLQASYEQSPYVPIDEDWGKLWHFKKGQRLVVILHRSEEGACFDVEELMVLNERTASLPEILRRTALLPEEFTDEDLEVLRVASPSLHRRVFDESAGERAIRAEGARRRRDVMMAAAGISALIGLGAWGFRKRRK